ncbi:hypothetical protein F2Q69_00040891 [Brassica cretica]|uniref:NAD(P)-binding domain-containing protein n=1 Tax=Brassica cretica TaxID=69181 RepID=A0A8S9NN86_BRACR|nr:hypothetical protein F2Q69_00040891 [Brassica cretica]
MVKNILVTGGAGYIGSHAVLQLLLRGYTAVVIDNLDNSSLVSIQRVKELAGDRGDNLTFHQVQTGRSSPHRTRLAAPVAIQNMGDVGQDQAAINAQLLAANEELRASLRAITAKLTQLRQGGRPNGPRPPRWNQPDPHDTDSDADSTDDTRSQDEDRPNQGGRRNAQGRWAQVLLMIFKEGCFAVETEGEVGSSSEPNPPSKKVPEKSRACDFTTTTSPELSLFFSCEAKGLDLETNGLREREKERSGCDETLGRE